MIIGVGIDVVELDRFATTLARTPRLAERLFTPEERRRRLPSLAARFAAKEAVAKALGAPGTLAWHDVEVVSEPTGQPRLVVRGSVRDRAQELGIRTWHLSLSHDGGVAAAMVIAEG